MNNIKFIDGFSKLSREEKIKILMDSSAWENKEILDSSRYPDESYRKIIEDLSENVVTSFHLPLSIAPNFLINNKKYHIPMVTEESSIVAAASSAAKFWHQKGGFQYRVVSTEKRGQIHFLWTFNTDLLLQNWKRIEKQLLMHVKVENKRMIKRGGGIHLIRLVDKRELLDHYFQVDVTFETKDAMGANYINTCLEKMAQRFCGILHELTGNEPEIIMAILSNYNPGCIVECFVECQHQDFDKTDGKTNYKDFLRKFELAVHIAQIDINRAVTHNKGIYNGMDAVMIATGNDFRAVEASGHAYASRDGSYKGLTAIDISNGKFTYTLRVPIAIGTVGGVTSLHPQAKWGLILLGNPDARELMGIIASAGLANNFSAIKSLITAGIQKGHMKMHLKNILNQLNATNEQRLRAENHFHNKMVSFREVANFFKIEN